MAKRHPTFREALGVLGAARDPMASMALARPPTRSEIERLCAINAELVTALEWIVEDGATDARATECARAAIAKAKEARHG